MSFVSRCVMTIVLLGLGLAAQSALWWHLRAAGPLPDVSLERPLAEVMPVEIGPWSGVDAEISDLALYGDDHLKRVYTHQETGQQLVLWMAYSKDGKDRGHHPEICTQVAGMSEVRGGAGEVACQAERHATPIQQFLYGRGSESHWIYYWHYTLKPPPQAGTDQFQRLYQRMQRRYSSLTLEVFARNLGPESREGAVEFVALVDEALQTDLPKEAIRGSDRTPVRRVDAH
jgi:hypothetical protein